MRDLFRLLLVLSCSFLFVADADAAQWARSYGGVCLDRADSARPTADGGYVISGTQGCAGPDGCSAWVLKLDASGNVAWQKIYDGDFAYSAQQTPDGGYVVAGLVAGIYGAGGDDALVMKLDASGNVMWQKAVGGTQNDHAYAVQPTTDGGYIVAGQTRSFGAGGLDAWILKLDSSGNVVWQETFGGAEDDFARSVQSTADGGYIVAGSTRSFGAIAYDAWVLKLDAGGQVVWQEVFGGAGSDYAYSVQSTTDGGYIVAGETNSFSMSFPDAWVLKLDARGKVVWQRAYGARDYEHRADSVQPTDDGGWIVAGRSSSRGAFAYYAWVMKLDAGGSVVWQRTYSGSVSAEAHSAYPTADGGYVVAGQLNHADGRAFDAWVLKLDTNGAIVGCAIMGASNAIPTNTNAAARSSTADAVAGGASTVSGGTSSRTYMTASQQQCYAEAPAIAEITAVSEGALFVLAALVAALGIPLAQRHT